MTLINSCIINFFSLEFALRKPRLNPHNHKESNCPVCKSYLTRLDNYRQSISRGELSRENILRLSVISHSNNTRQGKRKFDLPKPRLVRPFLVIGDKS